ncbi:MAG: U32 family peptidase [Ruminococcaceae bacterium]|nr:U32 family peptidase [Oscillospiraceae bacterium]
MRSYEHMELLAPAGNMECLRAAVFAGADAVYFAGKLFGARSYADNFSDDELKEAVDFCHLHRVKAYITVNTLVSDREILEAMEYLKMLCEIGVDAVIVQDFGLCSLIRKNFPQLPIHGSTQMTVHNADGVLSLEKMGISQVVLSRELSLDEIRRIKEKTNAKLEVFAHGALCMCYSGQCLMSSVLGGRSGNRGRCAQPCRLEYKINDNPKKGFYMSLKDLSSVEHIKKLCEIGVSSLKIEGRMKGPSYVATVVGIYRKYIDNGQMPTMADIEKLDRIFYRGGQTDGYLTGKTGREMFCFNKPDNPYEQQDKKLDENIAIEKKIKLMAQGEFCEGEIPQLTVSDGEITVNCEGVEKLSKGEKKIADEESIKEKLNKTGGTLYEFEKISVKIGGEPFVPVSLVNELRRNALAEYEKEFLKRTRRKARYSISEIAEKRRELSEFSCRIANVEQYRAAHEYDFENFYVPQDILIENYEEFSADKERIIIETPAIIKNEAEENEILAELKKLGFDKLLVNNISFSDNKDFSLYGGMRLNVFNSYALNFFKEKGFESVSLSPELNLGAIRDLKKSVKTEVMVYGHLPLMITENCVIRNNSGCPCNGEVNYLIDRKGISFPVVRDGKSHRSVILNSLPLFMGDKIDEAEGCGAERFLVYFSVETSECVKNVCEAFFKGREFEGQYTRLHFNKGVL